jgi:hypothetical protein
MKGIFASALLHCALFGSFAQTIPLSVKGDNTVIITTDLSEDEALKLMVQILSTEGYSITNVDKEMYIISTSERKTSKGNGSMKVNALITKKEKTTIILTGLVTMNMSLYSYGVEHKNSWYRIEHKGAKGSVLRISWNDLTKLAIKFPEGTISFSNSN